VLKGVGRDLEWVFVGEDGNPRYNNIRCDEVGMSGSFVMDFAAGSHEAVTHPLVPKLELGNEGKHFNNQGQSFWIPAWKQGLLIKL